MRELPYGGVLTYHRNIHTCGVARFNHYLARHLAVPLLDYQQVQTRDGRDLLVSIKFSEILSEDLGLIADALRRVPRFSVIFHDFIESAVAIDLMQRATRAMGLNSEVCALMRQHRSDVVLGFTVASYDLPQSLPLPELTLITFGMAHKIQATGYEKVAKLLRADPRTHVLEISSALHEGTAFDDSFFEVGAEISKCFRGRVRFLGFLADEEVSLRVSRASAMLAFFPSGARENNNSVMSAMRLAVPVITNLDEASPHWLRHDESVFDVNQLDTFPQPDDLRRVGAHGRTATQHLTYGELMSILHGND